MVQVTLPRGLNLPQETPLSGSQPFVVVARDSAIKGERGRWVGDRGKREGRGRKKKEKKERKKRGKEKIKSQKVNAGPKWLYGFRFIFFCVGSFS